jgi:hypothetical protein
VHIARDGIFYSFQCYDEQLFVTPRFLWGAIFGAREKLDMPEEPAWPLFNVTFP